MPSERTRRGSWRGGALSLAVLLLQAGPLQANEAPSAVITVEGEASADLVPDIAHLSLGVEAERPTAAAATADAATASQSVLAAAAAEGIVPADVTTTGIALEPLYPDNPGTSQTRPPRAFHAAATFRITVRPAERAGLVASHLVDKGANTIEGIDYASSQEAARLDDLRAAAMRDARHKAEIYTGALGLHLGRVLEITPRGSDIRPPVPMMRNASILAAKASLPSTPGLLTLQTSVTVRWALDP